MSTRTKFTEAEIEYIRVNAPLISDKEGAEQFSKIFRPIGQQTWTKQRQKIGLRKTRGTKSKVVQNNGGQSVASPQPEASVAALQHGTVVVDTEKKQESIHDRF